MILNFKGLVELDACEENEGLKIGSVAVFEALDRAHLRGKVTAAIADRRFEGEIWAWPATRGYSEYTPGDIAELKVGPHNLLVMLQAYADAKESVTLWIADEPVNLLEDDGADPA